MTTTAIRARSSSVPNLEPDNYAHYRATVIIIGQIAFRALFCFVMLCMTAAALPVQLHATLLPVIMIGAIFLSAFFWMEVPRRPYVQMNRLEPLISPDYRQSALRFLPVE